MSVLLRLTVLLALGLSLPALAQAECDDAFLECKDDCVIEFGGSVRVEMKKRYDKCMKRCVKTVNRCTERVLETKNNQLDEGALDGTTGSDEVDKDNLPTRTAGKKKKAAEAPADDGAPADDEPAPKKEALREEEVPRSNRTSLKTDPRDEPAPARRAEEPPPARREEPAVKKEPVIELKLSPRREEDDLRDDRPRPAEAPKQAAVEDEPPPPPKKREKKEEPPKKKEEDHDDLRFY